MMLRCHQVAELVTDFVEERMPFWKRMSFQMHVSMCRHCRRYLNQILLAMRTAKALPAEPMPSDVHDALMRHFDAWKKT